MVKYQLCKKGSESRRVGVGGQGVSVRFANMKSMKGDAIVEALVCMLLVSVIGLGVAYSISRSLAAQAKFNAQYSAVSQMRLLIQKSGLGLCGTSPNITIGSTSVAVSVSCSALSATAMAVNGVAVDMTVAQGVAQQTMTLAATSVSLFGGTGTISVGN